MSILLSKSEIIIKGKFEHLCSCLNEQSRRIWAATEAKSYGWGGVSAVFRATGIDHKTIRKGLKELTSNSKVSTNRIRNKGGGRKKVKEINPDITKELESLVEPVSRGDPESPLRWTCKSTYKLAAELTDKGSKVSHPTVGRLLAELGYSLQGNKKTKEGGDHPDRNAQFEYINEKTKTFQKRKEPVISVDAKKKENIGNFKNSGKEYCQKGKPTEVNVYDFIDKELGKVAPYGVYDITRNKGWVNIGVSADTSEFAVESIRFWWREMGQLAYPNAKNIFITAD